MDITILGGGPAGLYCALLLKKADARRTVRVIERNAADATYGFGVVFSDRTLAALHEADYKSYQAITSRFVLWDAIDTWYSGAVSRCGGHVFAGLERKALLGALQARCRELGVDLQFSTDVADPRTLADADLLIAADGVNSLVRKAHESAFKPTLRPGSARYIWLGAEKTLDAFTFVFKASEYGLFQAHSYPFNGTMSTFIVECAEDVWRAAGLEQANEAESVTFCQRLFAEELDGCRLVPNNSKWTTFATLKCASWHTGNIALLGDSAHTAHFSIGSGTKLAMEDAIALANAVDQHADLERALSEYELMRRPIVELFQAAAAESQAYFENTWRYQSLPPAAFTFNLLTRSKRITYDDIRVRDARFADWVDRSLMSDVTADSPQQPVAFAAPPAFAPYALDGLRFVNRIAVQFDGCAQDNAPRGASLYITRPVAVSAHGRVSPDSPCLYTPEHTRQWKRRLTELNTAAPIVSAIMLNHAGRRGATEDAVGGSGVPDRPLRAGAWPLVSASPLAYTAHSQTPRDLDRRGMETIRAQFVTAACAADEAGFDLLMLHMAHGYLLASFLSPLTNARADEYGGSRERRLRFPLEVFDAVRAAWPAAKPLGVALNCHDGARGGLTIDDAVHMARELKSHGCALIQPLAGQTTPDAELPYGRAFLTPLSERIRVEVGVATLVGGYVTTTSEANTLLAGGRADLVLMTPQTAMEAKG